jgi:hypothetical protein
MAWLKMGRMGAVDRMVIADDFDKGKTLRWRVLLPTERFRG